MYKITFVLVFLSAAIANAQESSSAKGTVEGTIYTLRDSTDQKPFEGWTKEKIVSANVVLLNPTDSSIVIGDTTNLNGQFLFDDIYPGSYILRVTYIGFRNYEHRIEITAGDTLKKNVQLHIPDNLNDHSIAKTNFLKINEQGVIEYQPVDDYLVEISQQWGAKRSGLGDLRIKPISSDDIELRFWDGYGLAGTKGILLKKKGGDWSTSKLTIRRCDVFYPDSLKGKIPKKEFFSRLTTKDCNGENYEFGSLRSVDTVMVERFRKNDRKLDQLWNQLLEGGLLDLPTHVENNLITADGRHFVVELRIGNLYRASTLTYHKENHEYVSKAHEKIKNLAKILYKSLDPYE